MISIFQSNSRPKRFGALVDAIHGAWNVLVGRPFKKDMRGNSAAIRIGISRRNKKAVASEKKANQDDLAADFLVQTKPQYSAANSGGRYQ
jgi:hypothetical protein